MASQPGGRASCLPWGKEVLKGGNLVAPLLRSPIHKNLRQKSSSVDSHVPMNLQIGHLCLACCRGTSWRISIQVGTRSQTFPNLARRSALFSVRGNSSICLGGSSVCVCLYLGCFRRNHAIYQPRPGEQIIFCKVCKLCV